MKIGLLQPSASPSPRRCSGNKTPHHDGGSGGHGPLKAARDGPLHAPDPDRLQCCDVFLPGHRFHCHALGKHPYFTLGQKYSRLTEGTADNKPHLHSEHPEDFFTRLYRRFMEPLLARRRWRYAFLAGITGLLLISMALVGIG